MCLSAYLCTLGKDRRSIPSCRGPPPPLDAFPLKESNWTQTWNSRRLLYASLHSKALFANT